MAKVGRVITDPRGASFCDITLESGEKLIVTHEKSRLTIELSKAFGFPSDRVFVCDLDTVQGRIALARLTRGVEREPIAATPLGALVKYVRSCGTAADVKIRCAALSAPAEAGA